jgi:hypothetical protein
MATPQENLARFQEIANRGLQDQLDPEKRARFDEAINRGLIQEPRSAGQDASLIDRAVGVVEPLATFATGVVAEPAAGIAGLTTLALTGDPGSAAAVVEGVRERLTFDPRTTEGQKNLQSIAGSEVVQAIGGALSNAEKALGDAGFDIAGPIGGAIGETIPTAILEAMGFFAPAAAGKSLQRLSTKARQRGDALTAEAEEIRAPSPEEGLKQATETIKRGTPEEVAAVVQPDPEFFRAADELNINTEPLASFASQNPQFRAVEQGLASIPASQLDAQSKAFVGELSERADSLIAEYGGTVDKAALSDRFRQESLVAIDEIGDQADKLYDTLADRIPPSTRVEATKTTAFIRQKAQELGGRSELPPVLNRVLRQLETKEKAQVVKKGPTRTTRTDVVTGQPIPGRVTRTLPTHERLNQTRREIGQALNRGTGPFKDQETGILKALYRRLREDQDAVAVNFDASDVSESANALVRQRKQMEDNLSKLLGKDLEGSILPVVGQSLKKLSKGEVQRWDSVMERIPKSMRQEIVVSSLNDIFKGNNVQGQALNPTQFTKFMDDLDRSPATKNRLYKELPKESIRALENLRKVSKGVSVALQDKIPTGRVAAFFEDNDGLMRRLMGKALVLGVTAKAGPLAASAASEFINQTTDGAKAASTVLASSQFQNMIRTAVRDGVSEGAEVSAKLQKAEKAFERSRAFDKWAKALSEDDRAKLASLGTVNYLLQDREE